MTDEEEIEHDMGMIYGQVSEDLGDGFREVELPVDLAPTSGTNSWRAVVPYLFTLCCFLIYMLIIATVPTANNLDFFERDPSVSYVCGQEQVPTETLVFVIIMLPAILFLAFVYLPAKNGLASLAITIDIDDRASSEYKLRKRSWFLMWVIIGFASCQLANLSVTETLKVLVGRKRPCFFYLCNYKGYKTAVDSDDYSSYDLATTANRPGNIEDCRASDDNTNEAQKSWPSGHASTSFAAMLYCVFFLRFMAGQSKGLYWSNRGLFCCFPMILAIWISVTRIQDYRHHEDDILAGSIIGSLIACAVWKNIECQLQSVIEGDRYKRPEYGRETLDDEALASRR